jgi:glycosyltransferase involved in cell wall biosynthesis
MGSAALVHDYLLVKRGAERTFAAMASCWPDAPIYTLLCNRHALDEEFSRHTIHTSYLQRSRVTQEGFRHLLPFFPRAAEKLPVAGHDLILSSTSAFAHGVKPGPGAVHVAYCHTPFRYAWHERDRALAEASPLLRPIVKRTLNRIRKWDRAASSRVTHYLTNSELSRQRIQDFYGRDATVVHPPVCVERFSVGEPEDFFLVVAELVAHKRVRNALEAARRVKQPITVVGGGRELKGLSEEYGSHARLLGRVSDAELADLYRRARALVVPNVEEFGIAAVESQAAGRPVLGADAGGVRETVVPGETGVLVPRDDIDALAEGMLHTNWEGFDPARIRAHAMRFSRDAFQRRFTAEVARLTGAEPQPAAPLATTDPHSRL